MHVGDKCVIMDVAIQIIYTFFFYPNIKDLVREKEFFQLFYLDFFSVLQRYTDRQDYMLVTLASPNGFMCAADLAAMVTHRHYSVASNHVDAMVSITKASVLFCSSVIPPKYS